MEIETTIENKINKSFASHIQDMVTEKIFSQLTQNS